MGSKLKKSFYDRFNISLQNLYYIGTLVTLIFIMVQVFYAKRTVTESSQWEKAKITIENVDRFKSYIAGTPLYNYDAWKKIDGPWPDFYTPQGYQMYNDSIAPIYYSLIATSGEEISKAWMSTEYFQLIDAMNTFAYPIIMGYASELESNQSAAREFYTCGTMIIPICIHNTPNIGHHAKLLYKLWRVKYEIMYIDHTTLNSMNFWHPIDRLLCYEETEITEASLKAYRKKLEKELKKVQKEIEVFRKNSFE